MSKHQKHQKTPKEIQDEKMSEVDYLLTKSFIGMETRPSKLLVQDQILMAKIKVGKKAETKRPMYVVNQESTEYDKLALALVQEFNEGKDQSKDPKAVVQQIQHASKSKVVGPQVPNGLFKNSNREHHWKVQNAETLKIPSSTKYRPRNSITQPRTPQPLITEKGSLPKGQNNFLRQEPAPVCHRLQKYLQVEDINKIQNIKSIYEVQSYDCAFTSKTHVLVQNKLQDTQYLNDEIFGPIRPQHRVHELVELSQSQNWAKGQLNKQSEFQPNNSRNTQSNSKDTRTPTPIFNSTTEVEKSHKKTQDTWATTQQVSTNVSKRTRSFCIPDQSQKVDGMIMFKTQRMEGSSRFSFFKPKREAVEEITMASRDLWDTSKFTQAEGYEYDKGNCFHRSPEVNIQKFAPRGNLHTILPTRIPDILCLKPQQEPGCNTFLDFNKRTGREDQMLYKTSEMHRNIKVQNAAEMEAKRDKNIPMFNSEQMRYMLNQKLKYQQV